MPPDIFPQDPAAGVAPAATGAIPAPAGIVPAAAGGAPVGAPVGRPDPTQFGGALGGQAVGMLREGLRNVTPEEQQVLVQQIDVRVQDILGRAFGPEMFEFLAPFTAEERGGQGLVPGGPAPGGPAPGGAPVPGGNPLAAIGNRGAPV